jgi:hypothetical protein
VLAQGMNAASAFCACDRVVALQDERGDPIRWHLSEIPLPVGYALALATEGEARSVSFRLRSS